MYVPAVENSQVVILTHELFGDLSNFITEKKIDTEKVKKYAKILELLDERKDYWAFNKDVAPIDSIKIYGGYSTVYNTLYGIAKQLDLGIQRKENPKAAKEVYGILKTTVQLIPKLEQVHAEKNKSQIPAQAIAEIFHYSRDIRKQAISKQLIEAGEIPNRKELIKELTAELDLQLY